MTSLILANVSVGRKKATLLREANLTLTAKELVAVVGPNGAGKSTLMKCALGAIRPDAGKATIGDDDAAEMAPVKRARLISYLPQIRSAAWPIRVIDIVALGRFAYGTGLKSPTGDDKQAIDAAIEACGLRALADRPSDTLSGGELARTHCARAFAAQAPLLLADEPTASLDPAGQVDVLSLIRDHVDAGRSAMVILHDIALAATFADRIVWMSGGEIIADGTPHETVTPERIYDVFGVEASVSRVDGKLAIAYTTPGGRRPL